MKQSNMETDSSLMVYWGRLRGGGPLVWKAKKLYELIKRLYINCCGGYICTHFFNMLKVDAFLYVSDISRADFQD